LKSKKKILIVGGTGFIGYHLAKSCIKKRWGVTSISVNRPHKKRYLKNVKYLYCDISNKKKLNEKIKLNYHYIVNLGGHVNHKDKIKTYGSHYNGCKNLSDIFLKKGIQSFVQIGSGGEYGNRKSPHKENFYCKPNSHYSRAKFLATKHLIKLYKEKKFPASIIRLYQVYGPQQDLNRFLPIVIENCINNKSFPTSNGNQFRDFIFISDFVEAIFKVLKSKKSKGQILNIGTGKPIKIKNIIYKILKITKSGKPLFGKIKIRKDENKITFPNILKAKKILRWKPKISFDVGLKKTINHYLKRANK